MKPKSPEKSKPDEKDPEKSPTKKQEGTLEAGDYGPCSSEAELRQDSDGPQLKGGKNKVL